MSAAPTGTVTFLFTDIEGSTRLWERDQKAMRVALERHDTLLREAIEARRGHIFKTVGDAFCATFAEPEDALHAALDAQRALHASDWTMLGDAGPLMTRMGLHTGTANLRDGDYFGPHVNRAARIEAAGHGGQILLSQTTQLLVRGQLARGCSLHDWGEHRLKDLQHTERIYQLLADDLPRIEEAPSTAGPLHPHERVRVADAEREPAEDDPDDPWSRLEAALQPDEGPSITLSATEARTLAGHRSTDWREYRLGRVAEWSQPHYQLDGRFVSLTVFLDQGEQDAQGRWKAGEERYADLAELLESTSDPAVVLLGPPGAGKSTLLRRLELDTAIAGLRGGSEHISFFVSLSTYRPASAAEPLPFPSDWLAERWAARSPELPPLDDLLAEGRMILLLDALNEMPALGERSFRDQVTLWKDWLVALVGERPGNRVVFSCRSLDYSQSLSTPELRVPQLRIDPLSDAQVRDFLRVYSPSRWRELWHALAGQAQLEVLRSPYFLSLLVAQVERSGEMPSGRAGLFTGFVRQALRRELERSSERFGSEALLASRDRRQVSRWRWRHAFDLPERGVLIPHLSSLAYAMQAERPDGERSQVRIDFEDALDLLDSDLGEAIVEAGEALSILDEDEAADELMYVHQLVQEYFAARCLSRQPDPELVRSEWRAAEIQPSLDATIDALDPADRLPMLPSTGWEETTMMAVAMADEPMDYLESLMTTNLALAARAAAQPELIGRLPDALLDRLRRALVERSRDPRADLRARIDCGLALGELGDPRFERRTGDRGDYLMPPLIEIPGGTYSIGDDEPITNPHGTWRDHMPRHEVAIRRFAIGRFPVTNAEWRCFVEGGGYENEEWWDTRAGRAWRRGEDIAAGLRANSRWWVAHFRAHPELLDELATVGSTDEADDFRTLIAMSPAELDAHLAQEFDLDRPTEPEYWVSRRFNRPAQPVVGICWYEARAYVRWLSAQTNLPFRLPSEVEWIAATRGTEGLRYALCDSFDRLSGTTIETHIQRPTPVGIYPSGDTSLGVCDLTGNVFEWTSSAFGSSLNRTDYPYPYDGEDGRESAEAAADMQRVALGGSWADGQVYALTSFRGFAQPALRSESFGMRVAMDFADA